MFQHLELIRMATRFDLGRGVELVRLPQVCSSETARAGASRARTNTSCTAARDGYRTHPSPTEISSSRIPIPRLPAFSRRAMASSKIHGWRREEQNSAKSHPPKRKNCALSAKPRRDRGHGEVKCESGPG